MSTRMLFRVAPALLGFGALGLGAATFPEVFNTEANTNGPVPALEVAARTPLPPGFQLSVFAAEPDVRQPIGLATDPRGRLWVAENYTYSEARVGYHAGLRDRILVFEDSDQDGRFDRRTVFWDQAQRLTSVEVGLGGVWALALPHLVFIPDADGDAVPDGPPQIILDGFEHQSGRHTVANGLRWGPDGWLYGRHGIQSTSRIGPPGTPDSARTAMNVGIWRYHPQRKVTEVVASGTTNPWGMDWDARGEAFFINTVIGHLWHVIPGAHYRRMYGDDPTPHVYEPIEQHADHVHWATGEVWTDVRKGVSDLTSAAGGGHAHTGLLIYQGGQWPDAWNGRLLTVNYHGRRLNVARLEPQGTGFVGRREPDIVPFADPWFRGIDVIASPDGGVFISDWSDAGECHDEEGIHRTSGRLYRLTHGSPAKGPAPDLTRLADTDLARLQSSSNDWQARQARRVLADRAWRQADLTAGRAQLVQLASRADTEVVRLRALWALHVSGGVGPDLLNAKLAGTPAERSWAVRLQADASQVSSDARESFLRWVADFLPEYARRETAAQVRLTLASLLQKLPPAQRIPLAEALLTHGEDASDHNQPWMLWYGIAPLATQDSRFIRLVARASIPTVQRLAARRLAEELDRQPTLVDQLLVALGPGASPEARQAVADGLVTGLAGRRRAPAPDSWSSLAPAWRRNAPEKLAARLRELGVVFGEAAALAETVALAGNPAANLPARQAALRALVEARSPSSRELCEQLLGTRGLSALAAAGLATFDEPEVAAQVLRAWPKVAPEERPALRTVLVSRPAWAQRLLQAIASGAIPRTELGVAQARQIRNFRQDSLTRALEESWGTLQDVDDTRRPALVDRWRQRLNPSALKQANLRNGQQVFGATCGSCHQLYGTGGRLGPDLTGSGRQNLDYLLENILFPNTVVPAGYRQVALHLKDGRTLTGIVRSRTAQSVVFDQVGESVTVAPSEIEAEEVSPQSLMPEGLLDALSDTDATDLVAYLMSPAPPAPE